MKEVNREEKSRIRTLWFSWDLEALNELDDASKYKSG